MIDPQKLKKFQEDLEDRTKTNKGWINVQKIKEPIDIRILDPHPNLNGLYFLEVIVWWINGKKIISPATFGEPDVIQEIIDEALMNDQDGQIKKIIKAAGPHGPKLQRRTEYWIPVLKFNWDFDPNTDEIMGITNSRGEYDVKLIDKYIEDQRPKILSCTISLMKEINHEATIRGNLNMFDREKGFNLLIQKIGEGKKTTYKASRTDSMPMPAKYYEINNIPDIVNMCKGGMYTDEYMENLICNYIYGDKLMELSDEHYRYPEIREKDTEFDPKKFEENNDDNIDEVRKKADNIRSNIKRKSISERPVRSFSSEDQEVPEEDRGTEHEPEDPEIYERPVRNTVSRRSRRNIADDLKDV